MKYCSVDYVIEINYRRNDSVFDFTYLVMIFHGTYCTVRSSGGGIPTCSLRSSCRTTYFSENSTNVLCSLKSTSNDLAKRVISGFVILVLVHIYTIRY